MSEPMSSGDIEDVLSSIRRLVSEDLRPMHRTATHEAPAVDADKLILTPALRIVPGPGKPDDAPARPTAAPQSESWLATASADASDTAPAPEARDIQPEQAPPTDAGGWLPEQEAAWSEDTVPEDTFADDLAPENAVPEAADATLASRYEDETEPAKHNDAVPGADAPHLSEILGTIGTAVNEASQEWEAENGDASFGEMGWSAPEWVEEAELVEPSEPRRTTDQPRATAPSSAFESERRRNDQAEADAVAEILAASERKSQAPNSSAPEPEADMFAEDDGFFDETVLRDLVRDLIREELSGTLGERITRNVRKLVRAEINRALTARDFD